MELLVMSDGIRDGASMTDNQRQAKQWRPTSNSNDSSAKSFVTDWAAKLQRRGNVHQGRVGVEGSNR